jgi:hypothetical protein
VAVASYTIRNVRPVAAFGTLQFHCGQRACATVSLPGHAARAVEPVTDLHSAARPDQGQAHLMTAFRGAVDATFAAFGIDATYTPAGGESVSVRVIARRPDTIVGFGETRIHAETATFEIRASEIANPRPDDQLTVGGDTFLVQGEPERRDPDRLVWTLDVRPT